LDEAITELRTAIEQSEEKFPWACHNLGDAYFAKGELDSAIESYRTAISQSDRYPRAYLDLGRVLYSKGQLEEAVNAFRTAIDQRGGNFAEAHYELGRTFVVKEDIGSAI